MNIRRAILVVALLAVIPARRACAQDLGNLIETKRDCAICHLEWSTDFDKPGAVLLIDRPTVSMSSRESTCLGCHDGSVRDSRKKVWQEQSHKTGIKPPASMLIPPGLPLEDGKLACRTCHTAHNTPGGEDLSSTFFLRLENDQSQLCRACHDDKAVGPEHGSHPDGAMTVSFPDKLLAAGAHSGPAGQEVICQSCHAAHGTKVNKLLVLPIADNQLCLSCHDKLKPGRFTDPALRGHPTNAPLSTEAQQQAVRDLKTHTGQHGEQMTLACLTCHRLHDGQPGEHLLADTLADSKLCLRCHPNNATVVDTKHDLRNTAPTTRNSLGQTPLESGPCSVCHVPHQDARPPVVAAGDPSGQCLDCHADGQVAANAGGRHFLHPDQIPAGRVPASSSLVLEPDKSHPGRADLTCPTCHNPHDASRARFLRAAPDELCGTCHADQMGTLAGAHDFKNHANARNGLDQTVDQSGRCGFCHNVHRGSGPAMWAATKATPATAAALCLECHVAGGLASDQLAPQFSHPTGIKNPATRPSSVPLPLFDAAGVRTTTNGLVECASCHNPHADSTKSKLMLRVQGNTSDLCVTCHSEKLSLAGSIHDSKTNAHWPGTATGNDLCLACHRAHSNDPKQKLWVITPAAGVPTADGICMACHPQNGWAADATQPHRGNMQHPQTMPSTPPDINSSHTVTVTVATSPLPLVPPLGSDVRTQIGCPTCHDPHASRQIPTLLRAPDPDHPQGVCFQCHKDQSGLDNSMHARNVLLRKMDGPDWQSPRDLQLSADTKLLCTPCHAVHATDTSTRDKLWAVPVDPNAFTPNEQRCLGCHDNQTAKRPVIPVHPAVDFNLLKLTATTRPLHTDGYLPTAQSIPCSTCHVAHGQIPDAGAAPAGPATQPSDAQLALRSADKVMIRRDVAKELCATCHGPDAARVFLYYHRPQQRQDVKMLQNVNGQ